MVGSSAEIGHLFEYNGNRMPIVLANTWDHMLTICQNTTDEQIDVTREKLVRWYVSKMTQIKEQIAVIFNETTQLSSSLSPSSPPSSSTPSTKEGLGFHKIFAGLFTYLFEWFSKNWFDEKTFLSTSSS